MVCYDATWCVGCWLIFATHMKNHQYAYQCENLDQFDHTIIFAHWWLAMVPMLLLVMVIKACDDGPLWLIAAEIRTGSHAYGGWYSMTLVTVNDGNQRQSLWQSLLKCGSSAAKKWQWRRWLVVGWNPVSPGRIGPSRKRWRSLGGLLGCWEGPAECKLVGWRVCIWL